MLEATAPVATSLVSSVAAHQKAQSVGATVRQWQCVRATLASREPLTSIFQIIISIPAQTRHVQVSGGLRNIARLVGRNSLRKFRKMSW